MLAIPDSKLENLPIELIQRGRYQPRRHFDQDSLEELCESIVESGVISPITVRILRGDSENRYELLAGERRWRASQMAGLSLIPAKVYDVDDAQAAIIGLAENLQREDLKPLEEARGYQVLVDEFGFRHEDIAHGIGKSRSAITNSIRLLDLPEPAQVFIESGDLKVGHAKVVLSVPRSEQVNFSNRVIRGKWSVRRTENEAKKYLSHNPQAMIEKYEKKDPDISRLEVEVSESLGSPITITQQEKGYKLEITCFSLDEIDNAVDRLKSRLINEVTRKKASS